MRVTRRRVSVLVLIVALALLAALAWGIVGALAGSSSPAPAKGKVVLRIGWITEPDNLNPFVGYENSSYEVWALNYDFLFGFGPHNEPIPDIATEIPTLANGGISADGKVWTIHLRAGMKWQDGQPLTAEDVAWTYNYVVDNQMYAFSICTVGIKHVAVVDPTTVKIICSEPKADMTKLWLPILPKHVWEHVKPGLAQSSYAIKMPMVGSGPFQCVQFKKNNFVEMDRNPLYWGKQPAVDEIIFETYQNADTMAQDLKAGALDAAHGLSQAQFTQLKSTPGIDAINYNFFNWDYLNFNCYTGKSLGNPVLRDPAFRTALNYAIDHEKLVQLAYGGYAVPATTIINPDSWTNPDYHWQPPADQAYTFDLNKASAALDAAGYKEVNGVRLDKNGKPITLRLYALTENSQEQTEAKIIDGWLKSLGIKINLSMMADTSLMNKVWNYQGQTLVPDFDLYVWDWDGYSDPGQTLSCLIGTQIGGWNEPCWSDPEYNRLNTEQAKTLDPNKRKVIIWRMQQIMYEQTPWIPLTYPDYLQAYNTQRWTGWTRVLDGHGPAIYTAGNLDTYLNLRPAGAQKSQGGANWIIIVAVVVGCVLVVAIPWLVLRRRGKSEEMADGDA